MLMGGHCFFNKYANNNTKIMFFVGIIATAGNEVTILVAINDMFSC